MKKKLLTVILSSFMAITLIACAGSKIVHCDNCGKDIKVAADSNVDDNWTLLCAECESELGIDAALAESFK